MDGFIEMMLAVLAVEKANLEIINNALHGVGQEPIETLAPWSHKEEVRQIQAENARNRDEYGDVIYD